MDNKDQFVLRTFDLAGWAEKVGLPLRDRYHRPGHPWGLAHLQPAGIEDWKVGGVGVWAEEGIQGLVKKVLTIGLKPKMARGIGENKTERYFWFAFGTLVALFSFSLVLLAICLFERVHLLAA